MSNENIAQNVRENRAAGLNPSGNPQMSQLGITTEQPRHPEDYDLNMTPDEHDAYVQSIHQYEVIQEQSQEQVFPTLTVLDSSPTNLRSLDAAQQWMPGTSAYPNLMQIAQESEERSRVQNNHPLPYSQIQADIPAGSIEPSFSHPTMRSDSSSIGPDRRTSGGTTNYHPYDWSLQPGLIRRDMPAQRRQLERISTGELPRVVNTTRSTRDIVSAHRGRSRSTRLPARSGSATTRPNSTVPSPAPEQSTSRFQFQPLRTPSRNAVDESQLQVSHERISQVLQAVSCGAEKLSVDEKKRYRREYMKLLKPRMEAFIATKAIHPTALQIRDKVDRETGRLSDCDFSTTIRVLPRKEPFDPTTDDVLKKKARNVPLTFRASFKAAAANIFPVVHEQLAPPGMQALDDIELDDIDPQACCERRRQWVADILSTPGLERSKLIHKMDAQGDIIGAFEANVFVPLILDTVLFQCSTGLGHTMSAMFANGIPENLLALASAAALCSAEEYSTGVHRPRNFSNEGYGRSCASFIQLVKQLEGNPGAMLSSRFKRVSENIVRRGKRWMMSPGDDDDLQSSDEEL
ncbi:hypothetical protein DAEQUDRAFT_741747 [Daedalea quercina L-15889]|uniref:DUF6532 domain-containing protein n=1 Tax=Daedalea quercina L-15889 TaxID=1314783 RepID=A0A165KY17_9APHY|nr:hypothetical protein DAEQUDRAFT_741747 [Daedalea quercina L-15889]